MRITLMCVALMVVVMTGACPAQEPNVIYIGLYTDANHSASCVSGASPFYEACLWIWALPGEDGFLGAEFKISYPANVIRGALMKNPGISIVLGSLETGISTVFSSCAQDWIWLYQQQIFVTNLSPAWIEMVPHPDAFGEIRAVDCQLGYCAGLLAARGELSMRPACYAPVTVHTMYGVNQVCPPSNPIETGGASWGAIKKIFEG